MELEKSSIRHARWHYGIINDRMRPIREKQAQMQLPVGEVPQNLRRVQARPLPAMISWWYGHSQTT